MCSSDLAVAAAPPDGYTLLSISSAHTSAPAIYPKLPFDTVNDFTAISLVGTTPNVLVVNPGVAEKSVKEFVALAKAKPGTLNYGSAGLGTANQLNAERFRVGAGIDAVHVPFKGTPEVVNEVLAGRIDYFFCPVNICVPLIKDRRLVGLGMGSSKRSAALPDLPTTVEQGVPESNYDFWVGMFVPSGTPREIVDKLYAETAKVLAKPEVKENLAKLGAEQNLIEPRAFDAVIAREIAANAALVKAAGIPIAGQ